jgi:hypothetical protein
MTEPQGRTPHADDAAEGRDDRVENEDQERPHSEDPAEGAPVEDEPPSH